MLTWKCEIVCSYIVNSAVHSNYERIYKITRENLVQGEESITYDALLSSDKLSLRFVRGNTT